MDDGGSLSPKLLYMSGSRSTATICCVNAFILAASSAASSWHDPCELLHPDVEPNCPSRKPVPAVVMQPVKQPAVSTLTRPRMPCKPCAVHTCHAGGVSLTRRLCQPCWPRGRQPARNCCHHLCRPHSRHLSHLLRKKKPHNAAQSRADTTRCVHTRLWG